MQPIISNFSKLVEFTSRHTAYYYMFQFNGRRLARPSLYRSYKPQGMYPWLKGSYRRCHFLNITSLQISPRDAFVKSYRRKRYHNNYYSLTIFDDKVVRKSAVRLFIKIGFKNAFGSRQSTPAISYSVLKVRYVPYYKNCYEDVASEFFEIDGLVGRWLLICNIS